MSIKSFSKSWFLYDNIDRIKIINFVKTFKMKNQLLVEGIFLAAINFIAFFVMYLDKARSKKTGAERIPEGIMFFFAATFGSLGVLGGMFAFRHKTAKWYFIIGIPLLVLQNISTLYMLYYYFFMKA